MYIHHVSLCTTDMPRIVAFYKLYFGAQEHSSYFNPKTGHSSCFLQFAGGAMLEVVSRPAFARRATDPNSGFGHLCIGASSDDGVNAQVQMLVADGHTILSPPRRHSSGSYESTVLDPDGNWVEIRSIQTAPQVQTQAQVAQGGVE